MKKLLFILAAICTISLINGQTTTENYINTTTYQVGTQDGTTNTNTQLNLVSDDKIESVTYFDGLGRPMQSIAKQAGGQKQDIITPIVYDDYGRQTKDYLPYARSSTSLNYMSSLVPDSSGDITLINSQYAAKYPADINTSPNPFSEKHIEASPLNRILEQGAPGADWAVDKNADTGHTIKFEYSSNSESDYVRNFGVSFSGSNTEAPELKDNDVYLPNELYKTITKDENWTSADDTDHTTEEYKDKQGRVILKRTFNDGQWHDTYYVYDDYGNLTFVLPPKLTTYKSIVQGYEDQSINLYDIVAYEYNGATLSESNNLWGGLGNGVLLLVFDDYQGNTGYPFKNGKICDLGMNPKLPDMDLGDVMVQGTGNSGMVKGASAFISNGELHFSSTGIAVSSYFWMFSSNLSDYESNTIPPVITQPQLNDLAYQYKYDSRNRLIEKKIPGKGWEYIVYNKLDQPVATQDSNLESESDWLFTKYDAYGRVAYTGKFHESFNRELIQEHEADPTSHQYETRSSSNNFGGTNVFYTKNAYPIYLDDVFTINYYDDYLVDLPTNLGSTATTYYYLDSSTNTKGLPTVSKVRVLDTNDWITTVSYYDAKARPIYIYSYNEYLETTDIIETKYNFVNVIETKTTHKKIGQINDIVTLDTFEYDHAGRLISQKQDINNQGEELIAKNYYDELGQLDKKDVGNTEVSPLQQVNYTYNIRGWLKTINKPNSLGNDLFSFALSYNSPFNSTTSYFTPLYNGNISQAYWKTGNTSSDLRNYTYQYDALNRLKRGDYAENNIYNYKYTSSISSYDRNGNIGSIYRTTPNSTNTGFTSMDALKYTYDNGNKLLGVKDGITSYTPELGDFYDGNTIGDDYEYDANGNMIKDLNKGIGITANGITYNHLNLPKNVPISSSHHTGNISYIYDATGVKLEKKVTENGNDTFTYYAGNYVYEGSSLKFFNHAEGYVDAENGYDYVYQYKDHLGNVRLSYKDISQTSTPNLEILEENNYYPFGLKHKGYNNNPTSSNIALKKKFAGEEFEDELGKNTVAFQWRDYDPAIGRFNKIDRYAEKYADVSPYSYTANNPMAFREVKGDSIQTYFYDKEGNRVNNIPKAVQNMFNKEFGIKVGYNSKTGMLYYDGDADTDLSQSESATGGLVAALKDDNTGKDADKHGTIKFGYNLRDPKTNAKINGGAWYQSPPAYKNGFTAIDLADFDSSGKSNFFSYSPALNPRSYNMARVFEHEYFGHGGPKVGAGADGGAFTMGRAVQTTNQFRRERGLSERLNYGDYYNPVIFFGSTTNQSKGAIRKAVKRMTTSTNELFIKRK